MDFRALAAISRPYRVPACWFAPLRAALYLWEIDRSFPPFCNSACFRRLRIIFIASRLAGPFANVPAVLLTGLAVPLGFFTLAASLVSQSAGGVVRKASGSHSLDARRVGALVCPLAWSELSHSGTVDCSNGHLCWTRGRALGGRSPRVGNSGGDRARSIALLAVAATHRDVSLSPSLESTDASK